MNEEDALSWSRVERAREALEDWPGSYRGKIQTINVGENATFRIRAPGGIFALRLYRPRRWRNEEILVEHQFLAHLGVEFGVQPPIPGKDRGTLQIQPDGGRAALFPWLPGRCLGSPGVATLRRLGSLLGSLHTRCSSFVPQGPRVQWNAETMVRKSLEQLRARHREVAPELELSSFEASVGRGLARWHSLDLPEAMIHADLHWGNVKCQGQQFHLLDFDDCGWAPLAYDLATISYATPLCLNGRGVEILVDSYNQTARVPTTPEAVHLLTWARFLWLVGWILDRPEIFPGEALASRVQANLARASRQAERLGLVSGA